MLEAVDYFLLLAVLTVSLGIGLYHSRTGGHQRTTAEFILNNRQLKVLPTLLSCVASFQSAISVMYAPAEYYQWGTQMWLVGEMSQVFTITIVERLIVPVFYKLQLTSIYDYFELRYQSKAVRCLASVLGVLFALAYTSITMLGASIALETMTNLPFQAGIVIMVGCCAIYTALGGMRAVIWTDVLQIVVMVTGLLVFFILGANEAGGLAKVFDAGRSTGRIFYAKFDVDPRIRMTFFSLLTSCIPMGLYSYGFSQPAFQRYVALPSLGKARLMMLLFGPFIVLYVSLCYIVGVGTFAYFSNLKCDPFQSGILTSPNQLMPFFVKILFTNKSGGQGLFLAVVYSASLSSASSSLSGCAANLWEDLIKPMFPGVSEDKGALANRLLVIVFAILTGGVAVLSAYVPGNLMQIFGTITGSIQGPLTGMFILALCTRCSEWRGAVIGCIAGMVMTAWISIGSFFFPNGTPPLPQLSTEGCARLLTNYSDIHYSIMPNLNYTIMESQVPTGIQNLYTISYQWFVPIGCFTTVIVGYFSSKLLCKVFSVSYPIVKHNHLVHFWDLLNMDGWHGLCNKNQTQGRVDIGTDKVLIEHNDKMEMPKSLMYR